MSTFLKVENAVKRAEGNTEHQFTFHHQICVGCYVTCHTYDSIAVPTIFSTLIV